MAVDENVPAAKVRTLDAATRLLEALTKIAESFGAELAKGGRS